MAEYKSKYTGAQIDTAIGKVDTKQDKLISGTNIKTVNGQSVLGSGDIAIQSQASGNTTFNGKVVSVLGDSISAMVGYIPVADGFNLAHDPQYQANFGVDNMWWKIVINRLGAKLGICDAWDGTTVKNTATADSGKTGPNTYIGSSTRLINLKSNGTPDLILVYAGTNDTRSISTTTAGTFDATKEYVPMTEEELYTNTTSSNLAEAYTALIRKLQYLYPTAKIACICPAYGRPFALYPQGRVMALKIIRDVCDYFGALFIDPIKAGLNINNTFNGVTTYYKDGIHPNKDGMKLIGDYVYKQVVNAFEVTEGENVVYSVTNNLNTLTTSMPQVKGVSKGKTYSAKLSGTTDFTGVTVYMGTNNVTSTVLGTDGTITISNVTGNIIISDTEIDPPVIKTYSITFEENGGSVVTDLTGQTNLPSTLPTTVKSGYIFNGWYTDSTLTNKAVAGATLSANVTLYAKWLEIPAEPDEPDEPDEPVVPDEPIDPSAVTWYADYTTNGGSFNYHGTFPGFAFAEDVSVAKIQGVPINVVKVLPKLAGPMAIYKVTGTTTSELVRATDPIATFEMLESDLITSNPTDDSQAKIYHLGKTITLANNERLLIKSEGATTTSIYVNTSNVPSGAQAVVSIPVEGTTGTPRVESWCATVGYGYIE